MNNLSKTQNAIFEYIKNKISQTGVAPSVREIAAAVGLRSTSSVQYNLNILELSLIHISEPTRRP